MVGLVSTYSASSSCLVSTYSASSSYLVSWSTMDAVGTLGSGGAVVRSGET